MAVYEASRHGPQIIYRFTGIRQWVLRWWKRPFWFFREMTLTFSSNWEFQYKVDVLSSWSPPESLIRPSATGKWMFHFLGEISSLSHWVFWSRFPIRPSSPTPQGLRSVRHPSQFSSTYRIIPNSSRSMKMNPNMMSLMISRMKKMFFYETFCWIQTQSLRCPCSERSIWLYMRFLSLTATSGTDCSLFSLCRFVNFSFASQCWSLRETWCLFPFVNTA